MSTTRSSRTVKPSSPETSPTRPRKPRGSHHHTSASRTSFSGKNPRLTLPKEDLINYEAMVSSHRDLQPRRQSPRKRDDGSLDEGSRLSDVQLVLDYRPVDNENFQHLRDANLYGHPRQNLPHAGPSHAYVHDFHPSHRYPRQRSSSPRSVDPDIPIIPSSQLFRPEPQRSFTSRPPRQQDSSDDVRDVFAVEDSDDQVPFGQPTSNRRSSMNQKGSVPRKGGFVAHAKKPSIDQRSTKERPRSPMKSRASPTKDSSSPMKPAMMFRAEELEEVEETVEDPEGPFTDDLKDAGIEYTGRNAVQDSSGGQARREGNGGKASSSKQSIAGPSASRQEPTGGHLPRRPMRDRHGLPVSSASSGYRGLSPHQGPPKHGEAKSEGRIPLQRNDSFLFNLPAAST